MRVHEQFEWESAKARDNLAKHRVSFDDAQIVLSDEQGDFFHLEEYDDQHSFDEDRFVTIGSDPFKRSRILVIVWTQRTAPDGPVTRIISARTATVRERRKYATYVGNII